MEIAYRMQTEALESLRHPQGVEGDARALRPRQHARGCLMAVRLVERGVRMVQVYYAKGDPWTTTTTSSCTARRRATADQPFAAVSRT
jgi:hypothetical protein